MAYDFDTAQIMFDLYVEAEKAVLKNQSYTIGDKKLERADLKEIRDGRKFWKSELDIANPSNSKKSGVTMKKAVYSV